MQITTLDLTPIELIALRDALSIATVEQRQHVKEANRNAHASVGALKRLSTLEALLDTVKQRCLLLRG